jgi:nucleotide-binding universal stress UspA family protein
MTFRKILCAVDFSAGSHRAMEMAVRLAGESDAELELVHAWYLPAMMYSGEYVIPAEAVQQLADDSQRELDACVTDARALGANRVTTKLLSGVPWSMLTEAAEDPAVDLIVLGTHGRTGLARVLLGSVAEKIVRHAPCSVMVVRPDSTIARFERILCATDFSDSSRDAMELAASLAKPGGKGIALLHVLDVPVPYAGEPHPPEIYRDLDRTSAAVLDKWAGELRTKVDVPVETRWRIGYAGAQILHAVDKEPAIDLVVMGSHGRTGLKRVFLGSVAEKVVRHARCPVLVARRRA